MELLELLGITSETPLLERIFFYSLDKLIIAIIVTVLAGLLLWLLHQQSENAKLKKNKEAEKDQLVSTKIFGFAEKAMLAAHAATSDHRSGGFSMKHIGEQSQAIHMLMVQRDLNKRAFKPFSE